MTKRKNKNKHPAGSKPPDTSDNNNSQASASAAEVKHGKDSGSGSGTRAKKASGSSSVASPLNISRNKHWRYISSFHGPWIQLEPEMLQTLAHLNFNTLRPHPVDPGVFYDLTKIRLLVDDATNRTVRARNGMRPDGRAMMSTKQKDLLCDQAVQKLAHAYRIDEIATSVVTMQGATPIDDVASHVLKRKPDDADAKYVHFFHEKIPSRQMVESTPLEPLNNIISNNPTVIEPMRTRATMRLFREEYALAIDDLTSAIESGRFASTHEHDGGAAGPSHEPSTSAGSLARSQSSAVPHFRRQELKPKDEDQPTSLEGQLLFQRAGAQLTVAYLGVSNALPPGASDGEYTASNPRGQDQLGACVAVKLLAKRALRDYMYFLDLLEYSPNYPRSEVEAFHRRTSGISNQAINIFESVIPSVRKCNKLYGWVGSSRDSSAASTGSSTSADPQASITTYTIKELLSTDFDPETLPTFPPKLSDLIPGIDAGTPQPPTTIEVVTYHPLLVDVLHSVLLCHALMRTPKAEVGRHATMVARLVRLTDAFPILQPSRSPARADWAEVIAQSENWLELPAASWELLTSGAVVATADSTENEKSGLGTITVGLQDERVCTDATARAVNIGEMRYKRADQTEADLMDACTHHGVAEIRVAGDGSVRKFGRLSGLIGATTTLQGSGNTGGEPLSEWGSADILITPMQLSQASVLFEPPHSGRCNSLYGPGDVSISQFAKSDPRRLENSTRTLYPVVTERAASVARWVAIAPNVRVGGKRKKSGKTSRLTKEGGGSSANTAGASANANTVEDDE